MARIDFAWELGGHTGHVTTLLPLARALKEGGHEARFFLKEPKAGSDLAGMSDFAREGAPNWVGPATFENPLNFAEILHNFGYHDARSLKQLVDAWRERLWLSQLLVANVAPAAHIAARTLGIPSLEVSQSFHIPPQAFPTPPLRDWEHAPRDRLEQADRRVVGAINEVLACFGVAPVRTIGELFVGRSCLLTYPELDIYPGRGPADYYGIPNSGEGTLVHAWPKGRGPRVFSYLYNYYSPLPRLLDALARLDAPTLMLCRGYRGAHPGGPVLVSDEPMAASRLLPECDLVICHGSHQMTAQALLAGKPVLLLPTQLEQFLITRRVVRFGAGLGIVPEMPDPDFGSALAELVRNPGYRARAAQFSARYVAHDRGRALRSILERCQAALRPPQVATRSSGQTSAAKTES